MLACDDEVTLNTQSSSQWDGLREQFPRKQRECLTNYTQYIIRIRLVANSTMALAMLMQLS